MRLKQLRSPGLITVEPFASRCEAAQLMQPKALVIP